MNAFSRSKKHIRMDRVKEMHEEKYQRQLLSEKKEEKRKIKVRNIARLQEADWRLELSKSKLEEVVGEVARQELAETKTGGWRKSIDTDRKKHHIAAWKEDWRKDIEEKFVAEGMTTQSLGMINLDGEPDVIQDPIPSTSLSQADNFAPPIDGVTARTQSFQAVDATKTDTLTFNISGSFGDKTVDGYDLNDRVWIGVLVNGTYVGNYLAKELGNGTHQIEIPPRFRKPGVVFDAIQVTAFQGGQGYQSSTVNISAIGTKRVNPMNLFVSLDDPEANSFMRSGLDSLSADERRKRLREILDGGSEYMKQQLGMDWSADIADTGTINPWKGNLGDGTEIAQALPLNTPGGVQSTRGNYTYDPHMKTWVPNISDVERRAAGQRSKYRAESVERKKLKSVKDATKKNVGFPETPPPKMINGFHPDIVTGDRSAKRFDKLDPASAKAMPKTAYPEIDKKVQAARKKPK